MTFFDDVATGDRRVLGRHTFTHDEIVAFARQYDPQPFHLDDEAAKRTHFGALVASGWHTAAMWMRYFVQDQATAARERAEQGLPPAEFGPSPGFKKLRWLKPVYAGDTIVYATEAREKLSSKTKPDWGLLIAYNSGVNQHGDLVLDFESTVFVKRR